MTSAPKPLPIARCPNPECRSPCYAIFYIPPHPNDDTDGKHPVNGYICHVDCPQCEYSGPVIAVKGDDIDSAKAEAIRLHNLIASPSQPSPEPAGELRDWIELLRLLAAKGEMLVMGRLTELADFLETLGDRQVMREALTLIMSDSGWDAALVKGADPIIFARMGDIHQTADYALSSVPPVAAPPAPTLEGIDDAAEEIIHNYLFNAAPPENRAMLKKNIIAILNRHITPMQATEKEE